MTRIDGGSLYLPWCRINSSSKNKLIFTVTLRISSKAYLLSISSTERYCLLRGKLLVLIFFIRLYICEKSLVASSSMKLFKKSPHKQKRVNILSILSPQASKYFLLFLFIIWRNKTDFLVTWAPHHMLPKCKCGYANTRKLVHPWARTKDREIIASPCVTVHQNTRYIHHLGCHCHVLLHICRVVRASVSSAVSYFEVYITEYTGSAQFFCISVLILPRNRKRPKRRTKLTCFHWAKK